MRKRVSEMKSLKISKNLCKRYRKIIRGNENELDKEVIRKKIIRNICLSGNW